MAGQQPSEPEHRPAKTPVFVQATPCTDSSRQPSRELLPPGNTHVRADELPRFTRTSSSLRRLASTASTGSAENPVLQEDDIVRCETYAIPSAEITLSIRLGAGGAGDVWLACWKDKQVAIKIVTSKGQGKGQEDLQVMRDSMQEISMMSWQLKHPNIMGFYGVCIDSELPWLVIEYMAGGGVDSYYRGQRAADAGWKPSSKHALSWSLDIIRGVRYLHERSPVILHRDIKPGNIMLSADLETAKLGDFGVSTTLHEGIEGNKDRGGNRQPEEQETGQVRDLTGKTGTFRYMAPEVFLEIVPYTTGIDIYSLSLSLWFLYVGEEPFAVLDGHSVAELASRQGLRPKLNSGQDRNKTFPSAIATMLERAWDADPSKRPTAYDLEQSFEATWRKKQGFLGSGLMGSISRSFSRMAS